MNNKVILVTGAACGVGESIVEQALSRGHSVIATARDPQTIVERYRDHSHVLPVALDVTDEVQAHAAAMAAIERFGHIDVLINDAGYGLLGAVDEAAARAIEAVYRSHLFGLLAVTRAVLPYMRHQRSGCIINFSSAGGCVGTAGRHVSSSSKFAVEGLTETLAQELQPLGIRVKAVAVCDPAKLAARVIALLDAPHPPVRPLPMRLALGIARSTTLHRASRL